jgi:predicted RecA/RadA family phage recombinase
MKFKEAVGSVDLYAQGITVPVQNTSASVIPVGAVVMIDVTNWQLNQMDAQPYIPVLPATALRVTQALGVVVGNDLQVAPNSTGPFIASGPGVGQVVPFGIVSVLKANNEAWVGGELLTVSAQNGLATKAGATPAVGSIIGVALPDAVTVPTPAYGDMFFTKM